MDRNELPFRKNCEGYFIDKDNKILAKQTKEGHIIFPGGGIDDNEEPEEAILRETFEETGAIINELNKIDQINFLWDNDWIKTEKQRKRFEKFKGEEMHFFHGKIKEIKIINQKDEDYWHGEKLMDIIKVIEIIENERPFSENIKEYRETQLKNLNLLNIVDN